MDHKITELMFSTCGGGVITVKQTRACTKPKPQYGGQNCRGSDTKVYTVSCNTFKCPSCDGCHYDNGVGYVPHPTDCRFFVQCIGWGSSYHIKQCPVGLYWKQEILTCTFPTEVNCTTTVTAAPPVQKTPTVAPPPPPSSTCEKKGVPGKTSLYSEKVPGHGWVERHCAPGTIFNSATCNCDKGGSTQTGGPSCQNEVYLPLNNDLKDHSHNKLYIENQGVKLTKQGQALFSHNAVLRIHRFSNMDFGKTLDISFLLHRGQQISQDEAVVTNAECNHTGSIYIIQKASAIEFRVRNQRGTLYTLTIPMPKATSSVRLNIHKGVMTGDVNGVKKKTSFKGRIGRVHCGLQIGRGTGYAHFSGKLENFKLSLCKP